MAEPLAPLVDNLGTAGDPIEIVSRFLDLPYLLFLDSATGTTLAAESHQLGRYSFLSADPARVVRSKGRVTELGGPGRPWARIDADPLIAVREPARPLCRGAGVRVAAVPGRRGGVCGLRLRRRAGAAAGGALRRPGHPRRHAWSVRLGDRLGPPARHRLDRVDRAPRDRRRAGRAGAGAARDGAGAAARSGAAGAAAPPGAIGRWRRHPTRGASPEAPSYPVLGVDGAEAVGLRSTFTHRGYLDAVARVREYIVAGDIFQANLSQRLQAPLVEPPLELYTRLRGRNPAAFAAYLDFDDVRVLSASPERFLRLDENGRHVETRPIKGTRPRGLGPMHDAALGRALSESDKDRAENVMIVDLLRNDLSRVCRPGTVRVPELFALEQHPTVHHLVSTVVGELDASADAIDLLRAAFPGGSITGAPKVRAMEIIAELEPSRRGVYCGSIGYLSVTGAMDTSIVIRTYLALRGRVYFQAGGGIVADSDPELEYRETLDKARALIGALARP